MIGETKDGNFGQAFGNAWYMFHLPRDDLQLLTSRLHRAMRWPPWSSTDPEDNDRPQTSPSSRIPSVVPGNWAHYVSPDVLIPTAVITGTILVSTRLYRLYLRRIPGAAKISTSFWRKRSIFGQVTSVGDGDGLRLFHTPGGRLTGWGWLRNIPKGKALKDKTVCESITIRTKARAD